jgi:protein-S-isoprenylcysteine O-methyltransferase Ste14
MVIWEDLFAASIFAAAPIWLVLRAWRRYRAVSSSRSKEAFLGLSALALLTLSLVVMVVGGVAAVVEEHLGAIRTNGPSPWKVAILNSSICVCSLLVAWRMPKGSRDVLLARRSIVTAGIYLMIAWLLVMTSPH